ncbi:MAG TPA: hypothetical protein VGA37_00720 [Gemmatimonadales bacterium]
MPDGQRDRVRVAVAQPLGFVAGHHELHRGVEGPEEVLLLTVEVLADALGHGDDGGLQLQHARGDTVDVKHHVGPLGVDPEYRHLFGNAEVVVVGLGPVDQPHRLGLLADIRPDLHAVSSEP